MGSVKTPRVLVYSVGFKFDCIRILLACFRGLSIGRRRTLGKVKRYGTIRLYPEIVCRDYKAVNK